MLRATYFIDKRYLQVCKYIFDSSQRGKLISYCRMVHKIKSKNEYVSRKIYNASPVVVIKPAKLSVNRYTLAFCKTLGISLHSVWFLYFLTITRFYKTDGINLFMTSLLPNACKITSNCCNISL